MVNVMIEETIFGNQIVHIFWKVNFVERKRFEAGKKFAEKILREKVFYPKLRTLTYCENPPTPPTFIYLYVPTSTLTSIARFNCVHFSNLDVQGYVILTIIERPDVLSIERPTSENGRILDLTILGEILVKINTPLSRSRTLYLIHQSLVMKLGLFYII